MGLPRQNPQVPAVPLVLSGCVVAMKSPHASLLQFATSLSFRFPDFYGWFLGKA
jgi:hypothetical protein